MKRSIICKVCGQPGEIEFESTGDPVVDAFIGEFTSMFTHESCFPRHLQPKPKQVALPTMVEANLPYKD